MDLLNSFDGLIWVILTLVSLSALTRVLHREIQAFFLLLTHRPGATQVIFALIFFPGVLLHELSHYLMAKLLGVHTGRFSIFPQAMPDGRLQLGYVETTSGGILRDAAIGAAPLVSGCLFVAYAAIYRMELLPLWDIVLSGNFPIFMAYLGEVLQGSDFWLWFYLVFVISSAMLPSASDRHAWLPVGFFVGGLLFLAILAGAGKWMMINLAPVFNHFLQSLSLIFGLSAFMHFILIIPFYGLHRFLVKITHMDVTL